MGRNKDLRKKISSWLSQIEKHEAKIAEELEKPTPDEGLTAKWQRDIRIFENEIKKVASKLPGGKT